METLVKKHDILSLSRLQLFRNVDLLSPSLHDLLGSCIYRKLAVDEIVLSTRKENHYLYVVLKGRLVIQLSKHDDIPFATVEPGECVGEMSIIDSRIPYEKISASEETMVLVIEREILWRMISASLRFPEIYCTLCLSASGIVILLLRIVWRCNVSISVMQ